MRSEAFRRELMVAMGEHVYLMLVPPQERLCWGHCLIVPVESVNSLTQCDERVWEEVRAFQSALERMCAAGPRPSDAGEAVGIVYLETRQRRGQRRGQTAWTAWTARGETRRRVLR